MIKTLKRRLGDCLAGSDRAWTVLERCLLRYTRALELLRQSEVRRRLYTDLVVRYGPFCGMIYPALESTGSALYPKLLGCYEKELHPWWERICKGDYTEIVDIGCAEGYYAVGLARRLPDAHIYAYDIDADARRQCQAMAEVNGVADRVSVRGCCDREELLSIPFSHRGLVVSDCEGYEKKLFTPDVVKRLQCCDFLIEVHDFLDATIGKRLRDAFAAADYVIETVESVDDIKKAKTYGYAELTGLSLSARMEWLGEGRPTTMEWLFARHSEDM